MEIRAAIDEVLRTGDPHAIRSLSDADLMSEETAEDTVACRLAHALLAGSSATDAATDADALVLLRHFLRGTPSKQDHASGTARVHCSLLSPANAQWEAFGFRVVSQTNDYTAVQAMPWHPRWLVGADDAAPDAVATRETPRRYIMPSEGDPFLAELGYRTYRSAGQRSAVRSVLAMPPGETLIVNLPTAMGKSLCGQILGCVPFLDNTGQRGVTVVVVPTIALAIDQARSYGARRASGVDGGAVSRYAYQGGGVNNEEIRQRIRRGEQEIVFAAPESLMTSLRACLYDAAQQGYLKALVIDEAHMVEAWGDDFRPAFQELGGLRRALLNAIPAENAKFRTVLLSATLSPSALERLQQVFGTTEHTCAQVTSLQLRPEPEYWMRGFFQTEERLDQSGLIAPDELREAAVLETLRHTPRPAILYVSEVNDAKTWYTRLQAHGFGRIDCMTGETDGVERERIISRWNDNQTDLVVATSAFGLGMDKGDIRTVIHACLPETIDRFFQEVGRGGRDGNACLSFLLYTAGDLQTAANLAARRLITTVKGLPRWRRLFENAEHLPDGRLCVDISVSPGVDDGTLDMIGEHNKGWNARTLTLLQQAGMIELDDLRPSLGERNASDKRTLRVCVDDHLEEARWQEQIETHRIEANTAARAQREAMIQATPGRGRSNQCVSHLLARVYALPNHTVARCCGGCPACRKAAREPFANTPLVSAWCWEEMHGRNLLGPKLRHACMNAGGFLLSYEKEWAADKVRRELRDALARLAREGARLIRFPGGTPDAVISDLCGTIRGLPFLVERGVDHENTPPALPEVVVALPETGCFNDHWPWDPAEWQAIKRRGQNAARNEKAPPFFVIAPENAPDTVWDWGNDERCARRMWESRSYSLSSFLQEYYL